MPVIWRENKTKTITVTQQGRYFVFGKRGSPYEYRYDLSTGEFFCWQKRTQERHHQDSRARSSWFQAKLETEDRKFEIMFKKALEMRPRGSINQLMELFQRDEIKNLEGWAALGINVRDNHRTGWGHFEYGIELEIQPRDLSNPIRTFMHHVNESWHPSQINNIGHMYQSFTDQKDKDIINEIFSDNTVKDNAGIFVTFHDGNKKEYLYDRESMQMLVDLIKRYKLPIARFMGYINFLSHVENVDIDEFLQIYPMYLDQEYEDRNHKISKMWKFPNNFWTHYMRQERRRTREQELENYNPNAEDTESRAVLEYESGDYCIKVPRSARDIQHESDVLDHCAARSYLQYIENGRTAIVFMRRRSEPNTPFITIEIRDDYIRQCQAGSDHRTLHDREKEFVREWAAAKDLRLDRDSWRANLVPRLR